MEFYLDASQREARRVGAADAAPMLDSDHTEPVDPLTVGELITLQEAAEYSGLARDSIHGYIKRGRLRAKKKGWMWMTTRAAVDEYLASRDLGSVPKKYRQTD